MSHFIKEIATKLKLDFENARLLIGKAISRCEGWRREFDANANQTANRNRKSAMSLDQWRRERMRGARAEGFNGGFVEGRSRAG